MNSEKRFAVVDDLLESVEASEDPDEVLKFAQAAQIALSVAINMDVYDQERKSRGYQSQIAMPQKSPLSLA